MVRARDWADREQSWRSYELFARYVMPRSQGSLEQPRGSYDWAVANRKTIFGPNVEALRRAFTDPAATPATVSLPVHRGRGTRRTSCG